MPSPDNLHAFLPDDVRDDRQISLIEGEGDQRQLGFRRLRQRALGLLGALQRRGLKRGDTLILAPGDNERFLETFWACVFGGIVPAPLAAGGGDEQGLKLLKVFGQLQPAAACLDARTLERLEGWGAANGLPQEAARLRERAFVAGSLDPSGAAGTPVAVQSDDLAFIQYSSGSTGEPKGVLLTHGNVAANIASIRAAAAFTDRDVALSWMPLSHDMGLIGFHLNMLAAGVSHAVMRTELFARRPLLWLDEASRRGATVLCSPNFGYQHYLRQFAQRPPAKLDLSAVRLIFNGAEPISAALCRRFTAALAPHGLDPRSMYPVYGLAEASLAVSFPNPGEPMITVELDRAAMEVGQPVRVAVAGTVGAAEFVELGTAVPGTSIRIADHGGAALGESVLGRVLIRGANVTRGYFGDPDDQADPFPGDGWLDTGDLGYLKGGRLVITGRAKDLVFVNGQNVFAHDLERLAEQVPGIETNRVVAAGVRRAGDETESLAVFIMHRGEASDFAARATAVRRVLNQQAGVVVDHLVPVNRIPKTTSGKLQRFALARAFEAGEFDAAMAEVAPLLAASEPDDGGGDAPPGAAPPAAPTVARLLALCTEVFPERPVTAATNLLEINLSSLTLARLHEAIEREFPGRVEVTDLFDYPTLAQLAAFLDAPGQRT